MTTMMPLHLTQQEAGRKSVRFHQSVTVAPFEKASAEEAKNIWFTNTDIASFRSRARELVLSYRKLGCSSEGMEKYRGFEGYTPARRHQRLLSNRCAVTAHRRGLDAVTTAAIYQQCNHWFSQIAFVQAMHDFVDCYSEIAASNGVGPIPSVASMTPPSLANEFHGAIALEFQNRSLGKHTRMRCSLTAPTAQQRRVRRRLC